jgi:TolB-like protein/Tfp pilus assembly protein PilF
VDTAVIDLLQRMKRRKLVQWALAYAAGAFALLQGVDIFAQRFGWPEAVERGLLVVLCAGFFVTLVLAWYHGDRGVQRVSGVELLLLALLLAIGGALTWKYARNAPAPGLAGAAAPSQAAASAPLVSADRHTIAVLPFVNMSGDKDNEYFSDGVTEEILNVLARSPALRVAARTSSFSFKGKALEVADIARALNVRMLLEGSVRKQGERARITAQLIDARNGYHLWSQTYDRDLKDIFAIQDEIAAAIAGELKVQVGGGDAAVAKPPHNPQAHDSYLRGLALWQARGESSLFAAAKHFEDAIAADPQYAEAYVGLALTYAILPDWSAQVAYDDALDRARDNAELALTLDSSLPEAYIVLGYLDDSNRRRAIAQALYRRAIALRPSFATAYQWLGNSLWSAGDLSGGLAMLERASTLDPRSAIIANNHGMVLIAMGRPAEAVALCVPALKAEPQNQTCLESTAIATLTSGDYAAARTAYERYARVINPGALGTVTDVFDALDGHGDRHAVASRLAAFGLQSVYDPHSGNIFGAYVIPSLLVMLGEPQQVVPNLAAFAMSDRSGQTEWAMMMKSLGSVHCDPAFIDLVAKVKTVDPHHAALCTKP